MIRLMPTEAWEFSLKDMISVLPYLINKRDNNLLDIPGVGKCLTIRSGRAGIFLALKALSMKANSKIGVPFYCCPVVFKAIKMAGHVPVFIDVDQDYCLSLTDLRMKASGLDALIAVHMFGNTCNMPEILKIMGEKPVIEDAAQSLGSQINGKATGTFGQIAIFSFRSGKYLTSGEGGAIFCKERYLLQRISNLIMELPMPKMRSEIVHLIETYIRTKLRNRPFWGLIGSQIWKSYNRKVEFIDKSPVILSRAFASDINITKKRMIKLNYMIKKQRENADYYLKHLDIPKNMLCLEPPNCFYNRFLFPIKFRSAEECQLFSNLLLNNNISSSRPYLDVIEGASRYYAYQQNCYSAERLLANTIIIPVNYRLHKKEIANIAKVINKGWKAIKTQ